MEADLLRTRRDIDSRSINGVHDTASASRPATYNKPYLSLTIVIGIVALLVMFLFWQAKHRTLNGARSAKTIAVLPFQSPASDQNIDFLRLALPDEIATSLTYAPSLSVRPTVLTSKYIGIDVDMQRAGRDLKVANIVTGHYFQEGKSLQVTLEAVDVQDNRVIWRDSLTVASLDMIDMRSQINAKIRHGLLPVLGVSLPTQDVASPRSEEAYDLYLRSIAIPHDSSPNREAISMLERSVGIDSRFAPAWEALGLRYYYDGTFSDGGEEVLRRADMAWERALALDPNLILAAGQLIVLRLEQGKPGNAYKRAQSLANEHPMSPEAHFNFAFVLRYAGLLEESARECDRALELDPGNYKFRSCAWTFMQLGRLGRAKDYVRLDGGSEWAAYAEVALLLREGKIAQARTAVGNISSSPHYHRALLEGCLQLQPAAELDRLARDAEARIGAPGDPEPLYAQGAFLAFCGPMEHAVRIINGGIVGNYCAYTALRTDPLLAKLRLTPEFGPLLSSAKDCQVRFLAGQESGLQ